MQLPVAETGRALPATVIIGGGIVGLATGWRLLERHPGTPLVLLEKEPAVAQHQSGHNSGVLHAGLAYRP
ncbi:MAG TPA: FAD-dependent oxidoreductase, partial [Gemmatimonadales bacterium]|nr:FAD-dependent oxidoreductase [Gemmatimonadales bacterium]